MNMLFADFVVGINFYAVDCDADIYCLDDMGAGDADDKLREGDH